MKKSIYILATLFILIGNASFAQIITTFAGSGIAGYTGDGGQATAAKLNDPISVITDASGNTYIADYNNGVIRKVNTLGIISTIAGNGTVGYSGDGGPATAASLNGPVSMAIDANGNMFIADEFNNVIRKINTGGIITTIAGTGNSFDYNGDGGPATAAEFYHPTGVAFDPTGNLYISDYYHQSIRKINMATGIITTIAGNGTAGYTGDGGLATAATLNQPWGIDIDAQGNIYIADFNNYVIRKINTAGIITTIAGNGTAGYSGDGGSATAASLNQTGGVVVDAIGNIYLADAGNHVVRKINSLGIISTIAGNGTQGYSGDGGPATSAQLNLPYNVTISIDAENNLYIADFGNFVIRKVDFTPTSTVTPGNSSSNPILVNNVTNPTGNSFSGKTNLNTIWFSFTAQNDTTAIRIINSNKNKNDDYPLVNIYSGSSNNLNLMTSFDALSTDSLSSGDTIYGLLAKNLTAGQQYFIQLTRKQLSNDSSTLALRVYPQVQGGSNMLIHNECVSQGTTSPVLYELYNASNYFTVAPANYIIRSTVLPSSTSTLSHFQSQVNVKFMSAQNGVPSLLIQVNAQTNHSISQLLLILTNYNIGIEVTNGSAVPGTHLDIKVDIVDLGGNIVASSTFSIFGGSPVTVTNTNIYYCTANPLTITPVSDPHYPNYDFLGLNASGGEVEPPIASGSSLTLLPGHSYPSKIDIEPGYGSTCESFPATITLHPISPSSSMISTPAFDYICPGQSVQISASGANNYLVTNNIDNSQISGSGSNFTFNVTPSAVGINNVYTISSVLPDCANPATSIIHVYSPPDFSITSNPQNICPGSSVLLTAQSNVNNQSNSYVWSGGGVNQTCPSSTNPCQLSVTPTNFSTTYYVTATDNNGCSSTKSIIINEASHAAAINVPYAFQCEGANFTQVFNSVYAADSYVWSVNNGATVSYAFGQSVSVNCTNATGDVTLHLTTITVNCTTSTSIIIKQCCKAFLNTNHIVNINIGSPSDLNNPTYTYLPNANLVNVATTTNYYVTGNLYFQGNSTISGVNFIMNPGSSITVDAGATLNIIKSHIYACSDMWQGINFNTFYSTYPPYTLQIPILNVTNSLIEDAITGVNIAYSSFVYSNPQASTIATQPVINLNNAWFNRCTIGILADYDPLHPDSANNAINNFIRPNPQNFNGGVITAANSVFSCLNGITMNRVSSQNYNTTGLATGLLHNYLYKPNFYSFCGIAANSSSFVNQTINSCYFDNLVDGIVSYDNPFIGPFGNSTPDPYTTPTSNLSVTSCSFQRAHLDPNSENFNLIKNFAYARNNYPGNYVGGAYYYPYPSSNYNDPYHTLSGSAGAGINFYGSQLNVGGSTATSCTFKNSDYGIIGLTDGASPVTISSNNFSGTTKSGIYMTDENGDIGQPISITSNTFKDHFQQGVNLKFLGRYDNSNIGVSGNNFTISAGNNSYWQAFYQNPATYIYAPEAIFVTSFGLASVKGGGGTYETFNITGNTIHGYEKGIRGISAYYTNVQENTIDAIPDDANSNFSYGVALINCDYSTVVSNTVKAEFGNNIPWMYNQIGIYSESGANSQILCNNINGPDVSLKCVGPNNISTIEGNTLNNAAPVNFWLAASMVGQQGSSSLASANTFALDNSFGNNLLASNGSKGNLSPFYYINHGNQAPATSVIDGFPSVAIPINVAPYALPTKTLVFKCGFGKKGPTPIVLSPTAQNIALGSVQFVSNNSTAVYGNQKDLYRALVDTGIAFYNADPVLSTYMASMVGSSHEKLLITDTLLASAGTDSSKINQAISVNNSFAPTGNYDAYLQKINNLYAAYKKAKKHLNAAQTQAVRSIALLCPFEYGEGVYKARALLSLQDTVHYVNSCEIFTTPNIANGTSNRVAAIENTVESEPAIKVYPNPANNTIYMQGLQLKENDKAEITIYNNLGQLVLKMQYNKAMQVTDVTNIDINSLNSGSYMYKVLLNDVIMQLNKLIILK